MSIMTVIDDEKTPSCDHAGLAGSAALFRAFGDPSRLAILGHLHLGPHRVTDLVEHLGLAQSTVSQHLVCLRDCGLVRSEAQGRATVFSLAPGVPVQDMLAAAEQVLVSTGRAPVSCATAGGEG